MKALTHANYATLAGALNNIGKMLGGWLQYLKK